jgi:hypothetical protein
MHQGVFKVSSQSPRVVFVVLETAEERSDCCPAMTQSGETTAYPCKN